MKIVKEGRSPVRWLACSVLLLAPLVHMEADEPSQLAATEASLLLDEPLLDPPMVMDPVLEEDDLPSKTNGSVLKEQPPKANPYEINHYKYDLSLTLGSYYDDNIFVSPSNEQSDFIITASPAITLKLGDYEELKSNFALFKFRPTAFYFFDHDDENTVEQDASIDTQFVFGRLKVELLLRYRFLADSDAEFGDRLKRNVYNIQLGGTYELSGHVSLDSEFQFEHRDFLTRLDTTQWSVRNFLDYEVSECLKLGLGFTVGWREASNSPSQSYQQLLLRVLYVGTEKLSFRGSSGVELRESSERGSRVDYVFNLTGSWKAGPATRLNLEGYRRTRSSVVLTGEDYVETGTELVLRQGISDRFELNLTAGYRNARYLPVQSQNSGGREDNYFFSRIGFIYRAAEWAEVELFYRYRQNDSTSFASMFENQQTGIILTLYF